MSYWWEGQAEKGAWVEVRREQRIGESLSSPTLDELGRRNPWYELVGAVRAGELVYHYNARESRFVGRSAAAENAVEDVDEGAYGVELHGFVPIVAPIDLAYLRNKADALYAMRDRLLAAYGEPLFLPFQFTTDRSQLKMMSNYFHHMPGELIELLFGADGLGENLVAAVPDWPDAEGDHPEPDPDPGSPPGGFLDPFRAKADTNYSVHVVGGRRVRTRTHETLVNACAEWLDNQGLDPARNAAIDLGTKRPPVVIEAKIVGGSWSSAIRQAVGQLYEYRFFKVSEPRAGLVFLANKPVPDEWVRYLERDRDIGVMWPKGPGYHLSRRAKKYLKL